MEKGAEEIGVRASSWSSDFIMGAGGPGGLRLPWARIVPGARISGRSVRSVGRKNARADGQDESFMGSGVGWFSGAGVPVTIRKINGSVNYFVCFGAYFFTAVLIGKLSVLNGDAGKPLLFHRFTTGKSSHP